MGLLTKEFYVKWHSNNKKWYEGKGHAFTKFKDEFEVKIEDLQNGSNISVEVECNKCGKLKKVKWKDYKKCVKEDGTYYCNNCAIVLYGSENYRKSRLKNSLSFYDWCYENLLKELADYILSRWDYELNVDRKGNMLSPKDVSYSSGGIDGKGYWFKCLKHPEHGSEQKNIGSFTNSSKHPLNITCNQCNTVAMTHPYLVKYLVNMEDASKYSVGYHNKIPMKCPDCGYDKNLRIYSLISQGFGCPKCGDGISFPERFFFSFLEQLKVLFQIQLSKTTFEWCKDYKYDFYINSEHCIIETHGIQHYEEKKSWGSLNEIQNNDAIKEQLAKNNNITYIILDCRYSNLEWIKNSIMNSELPQLFNFSEDDIDWLNCYETGCKSLVKTVCEIWNQGIYKTVKISEILKISLQSVGRYLKQGVELGWCNYNPQEEVCHRVVCLTTKEIFNSLRDASNKYNVGSPSISACCSDDKKKSAGKLPDGTKLIWMYYEDYILKSEKEIKDILDSINRKIICVTTGEIFNKQSEISKKFKVDHSDLSKCCRNKKNSAGKHPITNEPLIWMYYDEYLENSK